MGVDLSEGMVDAYNERFQASSDAPQPFKAHAVVGNLLEKEVPAHLSGPEYFDFDLAVVGMGFHHLSDVQLATDRLAERLKPGGVLMIVDFLAYSPSEKIEHISHHGFSEERVKELFGNAGLVDTELVIAEEDWALMSPDSKRRVFLARGKKPT
jgi:SAM-dependent methyltransferase